MSGAEECTQQAGGLRDEGETKYNVFKLREHLAFYLRTNVFDSLDDGQPALDKEPEGTKSIKCKMFKY